MQVKVTIINGPDRIVELPHSVLSDVVAARDDAAERYCDAEDAGDQAAMRYWADRQVAIEETFRGEPGSGRYAMAYALYAQFRHIQERRPIEVLRGRYRITDLDRGAIAYQHGARL